MLEAYFTTIKQDFNTLFSDDSDEAIKPTDDKIRNAMIRLLSTGAMALGIGIVFFALPIVSSGVSVLGLAIGIAAFIFGHDMFKLSQNWETTVIPNPASVYPSLQGTPEETANRIADDLEAGTILKPILKKYREKWVPEIVELFQPSRIRIF